MGTDDRSAWSPSASGHGDAVRHQVLGAAADIPRPAPPGSDPSAVTLYLALLQDRLPVFARVLKELGERVGRGEVAENLFATAQATIAFYREILAAKVSILASSDQIVRLRQVFQSP